MMGVERGGAPRCGSASSGWGLLALRFVVGLVFLMHGGQKLFVKGLPDVAGLLGHAGIEPARLWAVVLTFTELLGGLALILGVLTRVAALLLGDTMFVAIAAMLVSEGFFLPGYEFALTLLGASIALMLTGPGPYAIDRSLGLDRSDCPGGCGGCPCRANTPRRDGSC